MILDVHGSWTHEAVVGNLSALVTAFELNGDFAASREHYEAALAILEKIPSFHDRAMDKVAQCLHGLGLICRGERSYDEAREYLQMAHDKEIKMRGEQPHRDAATILDA